MVGRRAEAGQEGRALVVSGGVQGAQPNHQVAQRGQVPRRVLRMDGGRIFAEGDIAHIVDPFEAPVTAAGGLELRRIQLGGRLLSTISSSSVTRLDLR